MLYSAHRVAMFLGHSISFCKEQPVGHVTTTCDLVSQSIESLDYLVSA